MNIVYTSWTEYMSLAVKQKGMWAVFIANNLDYENENDSMIWSEFIAKAQPILNIGQICDLIHGGLFFFETESDMLQFFNLFIVSPIESSGLYACSFDNNGVCLSENT